MSDYTKEELLTAASAAANEATSLAQLGRLVNQILGVNISAATWRGIWKSAPTAKKEIELQLKKRETPVPEPPDIAGVRAEPIDEEEVYQKLVRMWEKTQEREEARKSQKITFRDDSPIMISYMADQHVGGSGVDYPRLFGEAEVVAETPGMYAACVGDIVDNFILNWTLSIQMGAEQNPTEEWAIARRYLRILGPKLLATVGGNHDAWTLKLSGIDYFKEVLQSINASCIYDKDEIMFDLHVGDFVVPHRMRHKWLGSSQYNDTHGIEKAAKFDKGRNFVVGIGAHTHRSGLIRGFNNGGEQGIAGLCGAYKRVDDFARVVGFPQPNASTAISILFDPEDKSLTGFENIETAAKIMDSLYG